MMLTHGGSGGGALWLGPDSDGLLNYCDAGRPALSTGKGRSVRHWMMMQSPSRLPPPAPVRVT